jgi:hypothetical protein
MAMAVAQLNVAGGAEVAHLGAVSGDAAPAARLTKEASPRRKNLVAARESVLAELEVRHRSRSDTYLQAPPSLFLNEYVRVRAQIAALEGVGEDYQRVKAAATKGELAAQEQAAARALQALSACRQKCERQLSKKEGGVLRRFRALFSRVKARPPRAAASLEHEHEHDLELHALGHVDENRAHAHPHRSECAQREHEAAEEMARLRTLRATVLAQGVLAKARLEQLHTLEPQREFLRNAVIDTQLELARGRPFCKEGAAAARLEELKATSRRERTMGTALRMRFSAVKGSKNLLQRAEQLLTGAGASVSASTADALKVAELVVRAAFSLPREVKQCPGVEKLFSVPLPWLRPVDIVAGQWMARIGLHKGRWKGRLGSDEVAHALAARPAELADCLEHVRRCIETLQQVKVELKEALEEHADAALASEKEILALRETIFQDALEQVEKARRASMA